MIVFLVLTDLSRLIAWRHRMPSAKPEPPGSLKQGRINASDPAQGIRTARRLRPQAARALRSDSNVTGGSDDHIRRRAGRSHPKDSATARED